MIMPPSRPLILVVDDDPSVRLVLRHMLEKANLAAVIAGSGREALETLRRGLDIALALLDVRMPDLDGPQTLGLLRQICPDLRTGFSPAILIPTQLQGCLRWVPRR